MWKAASTRRFSACTSPALARTAPVARRSFAWRVGRGEERHQYSRTSPNVLFAPHQSATYSPHLRAIGEFAFLSHTLRGGSKRRFPRIGKMARQSIGEAMADGSNNQVSKDHYRRTVTNGPSPFQVQTEIHYRPEGKEDWRMGETQNIGRSGVLFNVSELL